MRADAVVLHEIREPARLEDVPLRRLPKLIEVPAIDSVRIREVHHAVNHAHIFERVQRKEEAAHYCLRVRSLHSSSDFSFAAANLASNSAR